MVESHINHYHLGNGKGWLKTSLSGNVADIEMIKNAVVGDGALAWDIEVEG